MLRRFTGVAISDFGCAFNAYRRERGRRRCSARSASRSSRRRSSSRAARASSRSTSGTRRAHGSSRYSPLRLTRLALHVLAGFWPQPIQWIGVALGVVCSLAAAALGIYGVVYWIGNGDFPGPLFGGAAIVFVLGDPGLHPRARRRVSRQNPARRRGPAAVHDRDSGAREQAVLVTGGAGFISSNVDPPSARRRRRTRSSRSTRSPTRATSRTSPT